MAETPSPNGLLLRPQLGFYDDDRSLSIFNETNMKMDIIGGETGSLFVEPAFSCVVLDACTIIIIISTKPSSTQ